MARVLLIEDDSSLGLSVRISLTSDGHTVHWSQALAEATDIYNSFEAELIILDLGLPDGNGLDFCTMVRNEGSTVPIIILTAHGTLQARLDGLNTGADDYVTKPFDMPELLARVSALLRRRGWHGVGDQVQLGHLKVDFRRHLAWQDESSVSLTNLELKLLRYLVENPNKPVSRNELLSRVWGISSGVQTRTVDVFVGRLRKLIEDDPSHPMVLRSVRGVGYQLFMGESS